MSSLSRLLNPEQNDVPPIETMNLHHHEELSPLHDSDQLPSPTGSIISPEQETTYISVPNNHKPHPHCPDTLNCLPDTDGKPQHTLPVILRCAILGSPKQRLTIREIYAAMEDKYAYYKTAGTTWKQSVRHHLSLNRLFERQPRPEADPGFGSYWTVNLLAPPGTKRPRKRGRPTKAAAAAAAIAAKEVIPHPPTVLNATTSTGPQRRLRSTRNTGTTKPYSASLSDDDEENECRASSEEYETPEEPVPPSDRYGSSPPHENGFHSSNPSGYKPAAFPAPPRNVTPSLRADDHSTGDRLQKAFASYRRHSDEKVSQLEARLAASEAENDRLRMELRFAEDQLELEAQRRRDAEGTSTDESNRRKDAQDALKTLQQRWKESLRET
ncbi:hypothetical protein DL96DRAFT_67920 [Flagelloscypha sp. PMI_526]|nr:hypothetical protein DL96DRAFT_67920 [Flagelloscypha sp. PMI_526]